MLVYQFIPACWIVLILIWLFASFRVKKTVRREHPLSRLGNTAPIWLGAFLLAAHRSWLGPLDSLIIPHSLNVYYVGSALTFMGVVFAIWARFYIGRNWSGVITIKQDHALIRSGPYALVRHPIYSGLTLAVIGSAIARGDIAAGLAILAILYAVLRRVQIEESWMSETFGSAYADYKASTPALIPFIK